MGDFLGTVERSINTIKPFVPEQYQGHLNTAQTAVGTAKNLTTAVTNPVETATKMAGDYVTQQVTGFDYSNPFSGFSLQTT